MTELVRVLREQADSVRVDLDADDVLAAGRRRVARRRLTDGVLAALAVLGAALAGAAVVKPEAPDPVPPLATQSMESPTFSVGAIIRRDGRDLDVGGPVLSYVRVPAGTVYVDADGRVRLLPARSLESVTIGRTAWDAPHLVADPAHDQVAWVNHSDGSTFVVYDVAGRTDRTAVAEASTRTADDVRVYALDGDTLYARDARGAVRVDLVSDEATVLSPKADDGTIGAVAGGRIAWRSPVPSKGYVVGRRFGEGVPTGRSTGPLLSAAGTYLSTDDGLQVHVQRTSDGSVVTPTLPRPYTRTVAYAWADDDHLLVAAVSDYDLERVATLEFLTCSVSAGSCEVRDRGQAYLTTFNLPLGEPAGRLTKPLLPG